MPTNREILFVLKMRNEAAAAATQFAGQIRTAATQAQSALNTMGASSTRVMQAVTQATGRAVNGIKAIGTQATATQAGVNSLGATTVRTTATMTQSTGRVVSGLKAVAAAATQAQNAVNGLKVPAGAGGSGGARRPPSTVVPGGGHSSGGEGLTLSGITHEFSALESITHHITGIFTQLVAAGGSLVGIMVGLEGFKRFGEFEQSIATIKALRGTSPDDEKRLRSSAQDLGSGKIGSFGPVEVAAGMETLSRTGQGATDVINNITAAMHLAAATGRDLQDSTNDLARILSEFGIKSERSGDAVDVLTKTTSTAHIRMEDLATSMRQVGPVAAALGVSFNEVNAALGVLADNGRTGTRGGGTDLREIFTKLENPTAKARDAVKSMGLTMKDLSPQTQGLVPIFEKLNAAGLDASRAARIFGSEHAAAGVILARNVEHMKDLDAQSRKASGFSAKTAEIESDTPLRALDRIKNAAENVAHDIGNASHSAITFSLDVVSEMINQMRGLPVAFTEVGQAAQTASLGVTVLIAAVGTLVALTAVEALLASPFIALSAALVGVATYFYSLRNEMVEFNGVTVQLGSVAQAAWELFKDGLASTYDFILKTIAGLGTAIAAIAQDFTAAWEAVLDGGKLAFAALSDAWATLPVIFATIANNAGTALLNGIKAGVNAASALVNTFVSGVNSVGGKIGLSLPEIPKLMLGDYQSLPTSAGAAMGGMTNVEAAKSAMANRKADSSNQDAPLSGSRTVPEIQGDAISAALGKVATAIGDRAKDIQDAKDKARVLQDKTSQAGALAGYTGNSSFARTAATGLPQLDPDASGRKGGGGRGKQPKQSDESKADDQETGYIDKQIDGLQKQLALIGLVGKEKDRVSAITAVQNHLDEDVNLSAERRNQLLNDFKTKYDQVQAAIQTKQSVFAGINVGLKTYAENAGDYFKNAQQLGQNVFSTLEESLSSFVSTGKLSFRSMVSEMLIEAERLLIIRPMLAGLSKSLGGLFGGSSGSSGGGIFSALGSLLTGGSSSVVTTAVAGAAGIGRNANGTNAWTGGATWIGENGPELMMAPRGAAIIPNHAIKGMGSSNVFAPTITNTISMNGSSGNAAQDKAHADMVQAQLNAAMDAKMEQWATNQMRPGGMLTRKKL